MEKADIVGVWRLVSWEMIDGEGHKTSIYGDNPLGCLIYTADGYMSAHLSQANPVSFQNASYFAAKPEEAFNYYQHFFSYAGRYELDRDFAVHHIEVCSFPNWIGSSQKRQLKVQEDRLYIMHEIDNNKRAELVWKRC